MTDITTTHLDLAIIDQMVAGSFAGQRYAFTPVMDEAGRYILGVAVEGERGYSPITGKTTRNMAEAHEWAAGLNEHIGLSARDAACIVCSTMRFT